MIPNSFRFQKYIPILMLILKPILMLLDIILIPFIFLSGIIFYIIRLIDINHLESMEITKKILRWIGVYPVLNHFYDPLPNPETFRHTLDKERKLPGVDFNINLQLEILDKFNFNDEFSGFPLNFKGKLEYFYINYSFLPIDAQYLYNIIRFFKPKKLIEIGCGFSTLVSAKALEKNQKENIGHKSQHICIEPYRHGWLENLAIDLIKKPVEILDKSIFMQLEANDILFIDSSHMIRPQGDVLFEYLEILPILKPGVIVHIHDIYTPMDYPEKCIVNQVKFWNEQYLLEAFLSLNAEFEIIGAVNYLKNHYFEALASKCPALKDKRIIKKSEKKIACSSLHFLETSSFWIRRKQ